MARATYGKWLSWPMAWSMEHGAQSIELKAKLFANPKTMPPYSLQPKLHGAWPQYYMASTWPTWLMALP